MTIPKQSKSTVVNVNHKLRHQHGVGVEFRVSHVGKIPKQVTQSKKINYLYSVLGRTTKKQTYNTGKPEVIKP
jgi:hypothetical protein